MDFAAILDNTLNAFFGIDACYFVIAALGLNVQFGYGGLLNFGQAAFMAAGAYGLGMSTFYFAVAWEWAPINLWWGIGFGLVYAVALAIIVGLPTLRLRADYLAIVTIALAELVRLVVRSVTHKEKFGGSDGLKGFATSFQNLNPFAQGDFYGVGPFQASGVTAILLAVFWLAVAAGLGRWVAQRHRQSDRFTAWWIGATVLCLAVLLFIFSRIRFQGFVLWTLLVGWVLVALLSCFVWALMRSPWGRVLKGIREDEDAVRSVGKNVFGYKMSALIIGAVIGMFAGMILALARSNVQPDNYSRAVTFYVLTALVLGGVAKVTGSIIGPMIFWALLAFTENVMVQLSREGILDMTPTQVGQFRLMMVGIGLIVLMVFRPQGIFGNRKEMALDGR
jgi:neutral amino acid transport system permease protein